MPEQKKDLFEFATRGMTEPRTGPPEIVRREPLTQPGIGIVLMCPALPFTFDDGPVVLPLLDIREIQVHRLVPSEAAGEQNGQESEVRFAF